MGDAYCGPSNPLQNLQKHTTTDRSLQQDRLTSRQKPGQSFRSIQPQRPGLYDHEYNDFVNAPVDPANLGFAQRVDFEPPHASHSFPHQHAPLPPQPQAPDWVTAFRNLGVSQPSPVAAQRPQNNVGGWGQEFMSTLQSGTQSAQQPATSFMPRTGGMPAYNHYQPAFAHQNFNTPPQMSAKGKEPALHDAEFESRFAQLSQDLEVESAEVQAMMDQEAASEAASKAAPPETEAKPEAITERHIPYWERPEYAETVAQVAALGHDVTKMDRAQIMITKWESDYSLARERESWNLERRAEIARQLESQKRLAEEDLARKIEEDRQIEREGGNLELDRDLAATAGELLDKVKHDQDEKFQKSEFLSLMVRIRDGAATIRHGQMLDGSDDASAGGIPIQEQDHDNGRSGEVRMTGALPTGNSAGELQPQPAALGGS